MPRISTVIQVLTDLFFPCLCPLCETGVRSDQALCRPCHAELATNPHTCPRCAMAHSSDGLCGQCLAHPPAYDQVIAPFLYARPLEGLIHRLKYSKQIALSRHLGLLLSQALPLADMQLPELLVPVPLHRSRIVERGFNQSQEIAQILSTQLNIKLDSGLITRVKQSSPQAKLSRRLRLKNQRGAFKLNHQLLVDHVCIVDDVMTTGATLNEIAKLLKRNGVGRVSAWVIARS